MKKRFYKPSEQYTPVIVVHSSYAWNDVFDKFLTTLLKVEFVYLFVLSVASSTHDVLSNNDWHLCLITSVITLLPAAKMC